MKDSTVGRRILAALLVFVLALSAFALDGYAQTGNGANNRFNVVVVLDASGSMRSTDPNGLRYEAVNQFTSLLAEQGNVLGGVVFHDDVEAELAPTLICDQAGKDAVTAMLKSIPSNDGWTNTGAGLERAVEMLRTHGDADKPSVILFLSDGNTEMGTEEETQQSLERKAEALQAAREDGVVIYSVCLNENHAADVSEMQQLSDATGGVFREVTRAEDLQEVFNSFYDLIYGTSTITLVDDKFPESGQLETSFEVPGLGVEEVNIIIYGNTTRKSLRRPDGTESEATSIEYDTFSMVKLTDVVPGTWTLVTQGIPGDSIKINMVYNTNLSIEVTSDPQEQIVNPTDSVTIYARLKGDGILATTGEEYVGYRAQLELMDAYGEPLETIPMQLVDEHFEITRSFEEGTYYYSVKVDGNYIEKESDQIGPLTSTSSALSAQEEINTPPVPVSDQVEASVKIWPFVGGSYTLDMKTLATDAQDTILRYKIESSSFLQGTDYTVDADDVLHMEHFSLSKGAFTISATDSGGLSCQIEVVIKTINIGMMALIGMIVLGLIGAAVFGGLVYAAAQRPWRGQLTVRNLFNHVSSAPRGDFRGSIALKKFGIGNCGLDGKFVATGHNHLEFVSKSPVRPMVNGILGDATKRVSLSSGTTTIYINENKQGGIAVEVKAGSPFRSGGFGGMAGPGKAQRPTGRKGQTPPSSNPFR